MDEDVAADHYSEIATLNHYDRSFKIRGRVVKKTPLRNFKRKDGSDGYVFSAVIKDSTKGIMVTFFNDMAQKFYNSLEMEAIYSFSDLEIKPAGKFNLTDNKFELSVHDKTIINKLPETKEISANYYNFINIQNISNKKEGDVVDVIGIVEDPGVLSSIQLKNGESK